MTAGRIKPEFGTDELVGALKRPVRLLYVGCIALADQEGLLAWTAPAMKRDWFPWDDDLSIRNVRELMVSLANAGMIFSYSREPGKTVAWIIHFQRHQPAPRGRIMSLLPAPPLDSDDAAAAYSRRDGGLCGACCGTLEPGKVTLTRAMLLGNDYPRNIIPVHPQCVMTAVPAEPPVGELDLGLPVAVVKHDLDTKVETNAGSIVSDWIDGCVNKPPQQVVGRVAKTVKKLLGEGMVPVDIAAGLAEWQSKGLDPTAIPSVVNEVMNGSQLTVTEQRVSAGLALAQHYRERGE